MNYSDFFKETEWYYNNEDAASYVGGTIASGYLREALCLLEKINAQEENPENMEHRQYVLRIIELLRKALKRHNSQDSCMEYDIKTGLPKRGLITFFKNIFGLLKNI